MRREYTVTPTGGTSDKKLTHFKGQYEKGNKLHPYAEPGFRQKDLDLDGAPIEDLVGDLINDEKSKDGIDMDLFPFLPKDLPHYKFTLIKSETAAAR